jgi:Cytotoxic translational repressor of toxin-antitoxin stability system
MKWKVKVHNRAAKSLLRLPPAIQNAFALLYLELELNGPAAAAWPNYGKLKGMPGTHHCHLKKGKPTYVAVWWEVREEDHSIEVTYVGTHEKAPY